MSHLSGEITFHTWTAFKNFLTKETPVIYSHVHDDMLSILGTKEGASAAFFTTVQTEKDDFTATFGSLTNDLGGV